ncbi:Hypothetical protein HEAR3027 [Herminiimonas arsenicoxydans]|uniref:Uncharacterized protein n=1 Tax=Herminiimonas arsenicoxydans TaxID=204773 RepID=A4G9E9_HERAR|nr:Hypothetical protein HEAR3027 [Herminiimonas arsenicoxydans]
MSKAFKVGEKAIVLRSNHFPEIIGKIITITEPIQLIRNLDGETWFGYRTDFEKGGMRFCPAPHFLKKLDDDRGPAAKDFAVLGSWDKVGWSPAKLKQSEHS